MAKLSRRDLLKLGAAAAGIGAIPAIVNARAELDYDVSFPLIFPHGFAPPNSPPAQDQEHKIYFPLIEG